MKSIHLHPGRERPLLRRHPWIFASAIDEVRGQPEPGEVVEVFSSEGYWLAYAGFSPHSQIRARIWSWNQDQTVDGEFISNRIDLAIERRARFFDPGGKPAFREVYAESDGVPGLIVDRYDHTRVLQFLSAGVEYWKDEILDYFKSRGECESSFERSDVEVRSLEGLEERKGLLWGVEPDEPIVIREGELDLLVDIRQGHKSGFYLDQRENRAAFAQMVRTGGSVLDCFSYSGAFSVTALSAEAGKSTLVDSSGASLKLASRNLALNQIAEERWETVQGDAFEVLRKFRDQDRAFDMVVLDPPKFAPTPAHIQRATRGYKDINLLGMKLVRPGGLLFTFSCSGGVSADLFQKVVADAARDSGRRAAVIKWLGQPVDHPVALEFPEGRYLKGLVCRVE